MPPLRPIIISITTKEPSIPYSQQISPSWHHRICEITLFISLMIFGFYGLELFDLTSIEVPSVTLVPAGITVVYSFIINIFAKDERIRIHSTICYSLLSITVATLVATTGWLYSPFVGIWLAAIIFCGFFGNIMLIAFLLGTNLCLAYLAFTSPNYDILAQIFGANITLLGSYIIWRKQSMPEDNATLAIAEPQQTMAHNDAKSDIIINSIADGVILIDAKGIVRMINPAAETLLGWPAHDAINLDYRSVIKLTNENGDAVPDDLSPIRQVALSNKTATNNNLVLITKSGKRTMVSTLVSPVGSSSQQDGVIVVFRDITREKEQERQKAEFISTASHEMRTPVAAIEGYLGLALSPQTATIDNKARLYLQKAHESTQHLGRLFQDLLTVSKAEDARIIPRQKLVNITTFTNAMCEAYAPKAQEKGLTLTFMPSEHEGGRKILPMFFANVDPDHLQEILSNLIDNAIKYTLKGNIAVGVTGDADNVAISVEDSGIGIPPEDLPHMFQKFYRVDNSDTREVGGTGLGLYISRRLTEGNGGNISVSSTFGRGSTFFVQFPRINNAQTEQLSTGQQP